MFRDLYKQANNDIKGDREILDKAFLRAAQPEKKTSPVFKYSFLGTAAAAVIVAGAIFVNSDVFFNKIDENLLNETVITTVEQATNVENGIATAKIDTDAENEDAKIDMVDVKDGAQEENADNKNVIQTEQNANSALVMTELAPEENVETKLNEETPVVDMHQEGVIIEKRTSEETQDGVVPEKKVSHEIQVAEVPNKVVRDHKAETYEKLNDGTAVASIGDESTNTINADNKPDIAFYEEIIAGVQEDEEIADETVGAAFTENAMLFAFRPESNNEGIQNEMVSSGGGSAKEENVMEFSYMADKTIYGESNKSVDESVFKNVDVNQIENSEDAIRVAKNECTIEYDETSVCFDHAENMWLVTFTFTQTGETQSVYLDYNGITHMIVYGE